MRTAGEGPTLIHICAAAASPVGTDALPTDSGTRAAHRNRGTYPFITGERVLWLLRLTDRGGVYGYHTLDAVALALLAALANLSEGASTRADAESGVPFRHRCGRIWQPWLL